MRFRVYGTVFGGDVLADREADTDAQSPENREAYRRILAERDAVRKDPACPGHEIVFNVREQNGSGAVVVVGVERAISIAAFFLSGRDAAADKVIADRFRERAFAQGGLPEHEAVKVEAPGCYLVAKKIGDAPNFSGDDLMALVFNVENLAAAFFREVGVCA